MQSCLYGYGMRQTRLYCQWLGLIGSWQLSLVGGCRLWDNTYYAKSGSNLRQIMAYLLAIYCNQNCFNIMQSCLYGYGMRHTRLYWQWLGLIGSWQLRLVGMSVFYGNILYAKSGSNLRQIMAYLLAILQPELLQHHAIMFIWVWNETNKTLLALVGSDWIMTAEFGWWLWEHCTQNQAQISDEYNGS